MDWSIVIMALLTGACWLFCLWYGFNMGVKYERFLIAKEEVIYLDELPEGDASYWKKMYEDLADEYMVLRAQEICSGVKG